MRCHRVSCARRLAPTYRFVCRIAPNTHYADVCVFHAHSHTNSDTKANLRGVPLYPRTTTLRTILDSLLDLVYDHQHRPGAGQRSMHPYPSTTLPQPFQFRFLTCMQFDDTSHDAPHKSGVYRTNGHVRTPRTPITASRHCFVYLSSDIPSTSAGTAV